MSGCSRASGDADLQPCVVSIAQSTSSVYEHFETDMTLGTELDVELSEYRMEDRLNLEAEVLAAPGRRSRRRADSLILRSLRFATDP